MQVIMYVMAKPNQPSLRELIADDIAQRDRGDGLEIISKQTKGRSRGWSKIKKPGSAGTLNIEWDADAKTLVVRAVTRGGNKPDELIGTFISYVLRVHGKRISSISMRTLG
jgi:hypothetical protein